MFKLITFKILLSLAISISLNSIAQNSEIDSMLVLLKSQKEDSNKVKTLNSLGNTLNGLGESRKSEVFLLEGIALSKKIKYESQLCKLYGNLGNAYIYNSNLEEALKNYLISQKIAKKLNLGKENGVAYLGIGSIYLKKGNYPKALNNYNIALNIFIHLNLKQHEDNCLNNIGGIYLEQKQYNQALNYFLKVFKNREEANNLKGLSNVSHNIGLVLLEMEQYEKAKFYFEKSLSISQKLNNKILLASNLNSLGTTEIYLNNKARAFELFSKSLELHREIEDKEGICTALINLSTYNKEQKKYLLAKQQIIEALKISNEIEFIDQIIDCNHILSNLEFELGNYKAAYTYQSKFKELTDSIFNLENSKQLSEIKTNFEVEKKETELKASNKIQQAKKDAQIKQQKLFRNAFILGFLLMLIIAVTIFRSYRQKLNANVIITKQRDEVEQQRNIVQYQNKEILSSIEYAKRIQATILPPPKVVKKYLDDSFVLYLPKDIVAGDFYWMEAIEDVENNNELILFAACDCTGHGVPGALVSVVCSNALNRAVKEFGISQPSLIFDKVAQLVIKDFSKDENENVQDGMDASLCALNIKTSQLQWAGANNPLWIIRNGELLEFTPDKQPIGKTDKLTPFINHEIKLQKGDCIYLFTDGYADQFGGEKNKKYSKKSFKELIISINKLPLNEQHKEIYTKHLEWRGTNEQVDDICVIGVRV